MATKLRARYGIAVAILTTLYFGAAYSQPLIDEALLAAARTLLPNDLTENELRETLEAGLWHEESSAVATSIPRENEYMTFVFLRQPDGTYSAEDTSWVARTAFGYWGFRSHEIERFETEPINWQVNDGGHLLVQIRTRGWRNGQRYTASGFYLVSPDGRVSGQ